MLGTLVTIAVGVFGSDSGSMTITLSPSMAEAVRSRAAETGRTPDDVVLDAVRAYVGSEAAPAPRALVLTVETKVPTVGSGRSSHSYAGPMTDDAGALRLASSEDEWSRADWEKAAAAALRKSAVGSPTTTPTRRVVDADPHDVRRHRGRPLGTPDLLDDLATRAADARGRMGRPHPDVR